MTYPDEQSAAQGLLIEVASVLTTRHVDFVVVGGWKPFLFNAAPIPHPGTFDVDILLNDRTSRATFDKAVESLMELGYLRAPKNQFQLHRILTARGEQLVYHVDFLHRRYADDTDNQVRNWGRMQSIAGPGTDIIFTEAERTNKTVSAVLPTGEERIVPLSFCTDVGFLSAKGRSALVPKRTRDAFDIFLVVKQAEDYGRLVARSRELLDDPIFKISLDKLNNGFTAGPLLAQAANYLHAQSPDINNPADEVRATMRSFFDDIGLPSPSAH